MPARMEKRGHAGAVVPLRVGCPTRLGIPGMRLHAEKLFDFRVFIGLI